MLFLMACTFKGVKPDAGELEKKKTFILIAALSLGLGSLVADHEEKPAAAPPTKPDETPTMSEIPTMKA